MGKNVKTTSESQRKMLNIIQALSLQHSKWRVWSDFVVSSACAISNVVDSVNRSDRERMYKAIMKKYAPDEAEKFHELLMALIEGLDSNPNQDFLGSLYMVLDMGNDANGQFFTPYSVCQLMSQIDMDVVTETVDKRGWTSVNDPACGAGATLISFANACVEQGINYQSSILFVGQDIDQTAACMCYLQLSLLGCPGYIIVGNTLTSPPAGGEARGLIPATTENIWFTPFYFRSEWHSRRLAAVMDKLTTTAVKRAEKCHGA